MQQKQAGFKWHAIAAVLLALAVLAIYYQSLGYPFLNWDDPDYVVKNRWISALSAETIPHIFFEAHAANYGPLTLLSFALNYAFAGLNPWGYHFLNLLLHLANSWLVYGILCRLTKGRLPGLVGSLLFAVHPLNVESVVWVSERKNLLSLFFFLVSFHCYGRFRATSRPAARWILWLAGFASFTLACLAKSAAAVLPALILLYEAFLKKQTPDKDEPRNHSLSPVRIALLSLPFWGVATGISWLTIWAQSGAGAIYEFHGGTPWVTFLSMSKVFALYLGRFILPVELNNRYPNYTVSTIFTAEALISLLVLSLCALLIFRSWGRRRVIFFGLGWFFISLLPVSNIIPISTLMADRYMYFPFFGLVFLIASGLVSLQDPGLPKWLPGTRPLALLIAALLLCFLAASHVRVQVWKDDIHLWEDSLAKDPHNDLAHNNLALAYRESRRDAEALEHFRIAVAQNPNNFETRVNLGEVLAELAEYREAEKQLRRALEIKKDDPRALNNLGSVVTSLKQFDEAIGFYRRAIAMEPDRAATHYNLANALLASSRLAEAELEYKRALSLDPALSAAWLNLGNLCQKTQQFPAAIDAYKRAIALAPNDPATVLSLGALYLKTFELDKAIEQFRKVLELDSSEFGAHLNLAHAWDLLGDREKAAAAYRRFLDLAPPEDSSRGFAESRLRVLTKP